jgi:16S rRNA (guanine966-N2)-methyltransferase
VPRIVAGAARGRRLDVPAGRATRPTSDRAREALFSTLEAMLRTMAGRSVLDLYAGSGAVGLEALSRGARRVVLVDDDRRAAAALRTNVERLALPGATVVVSDVARHLDTAPPGDPYDVVFLDPPYATDDDEVRAIVGRVLAGGLLAPGGVVVVERPTRGDPWRWPAGVTPDRERAYGEGTLWYGRAAGSGSQPEPPSPRE